MKDKPFALVSISVDAEKKTLTDFLAKEPMPWNHWWNGAEGKLIDTLSIQHYPTIFVLDAQGRDPLQGDPGRRAGKGGEYAAQRDEKKTAGPTTKGEPAKAA